MKKIEIGPWLVAFAALLWAVDAPFRKYLTGDLPSATIVLMEHMLIALCVLYFFFKHINELGTFGKKEWFAILFISILGSGLATVLFTESFRYVNPSVSILLQKVQPLLAILLASLILKEKLTPKFWMWAAIGIVGAYLITFPELKISGLEFSGGAKGILFALLAALFWGGSTVFGRVALRKASSELVTSLRFLGALVFLLGLNIYTGTIAKVGSASGKDWVFVAIIALLAGFISLFIYYRGLRTTEAKVATIAELVFPFSAVIINWIFLGAALAPMQIVGGLILLCAITGLSIGKAAPDAGAAA